MGFRRRYRSGKLNNGTTMIVPGGENLNLVGQGGPFNQGINKFRFGKETADQEIKEQKIIPIPPPEPSASAPAPTPTPTPTISSTSLPTPTPSVTITSTPTVTPTLTITPTPSTTQVVWSHQLRYSPDDYSSGCTSSAGTYYTAANAIYNQILYTNVGLTNIAPTGYYTTDTQPCPDSYGYWGYFVNAFGTATVSILYNPCPEYNFFGKYDPVSTSGLCSASNTFLITPNDVTSPQIGDTYYTDTSNCVFAPDGYYSWCDCVTYTYDYFVISGGTGQITYVENCPI